MIVRPDVQQHPRARRCTRADGYWKRTYYTRKDATAAARTLAQKFPGTALDAYECSICERWHLGRFSERVAAGVNR